MPILVEGSELPLPMVGLERAGVSDGS
eukprot:SAG22_NODE_6256_length_879_cov_1.197436_1_plen_26_part_10